MDMMFCGCCAGDDNLEPTPRTPLLSGKAVTRQPQSTRTQHLNNLDNNNANEVIIPGEPRKIHIKKTKVPSVDKRMQDHTDLYNNHFEKYQDLELYMKDLTEAFGSENPDRTMQQTLRLIKKKSECTLALQRKHKYCMKISYNEKRVQNGVLPHIRTFNKANNLVKDLLQKGPELYRTISLVLNDEREFRRDVLAASLGVDGPECMKNCIDDIDNLRQIPSFLEEITSRTKAMFDKMVTSAEVLCTESDDEDKKVEPDTGENIEDGEKKENGNA